MKKLIDRIDNELVFYEGEEEKARIYFDVDGETLDEICDLANENNESEFNDRYSIIGESDNASSGIEYIKKTFGMNIKQISERFDIPYRTVQNWNAGVRECPQYIIKMMIEILSQ